MPRVLASRGIIRGIQDIILYLIGLMSSLPYNSNNISQLEAMLSSDRFETYVLLAGGSKRKALKLFKRNILLCHRLYTIIHVLEICLRNRIDDKVKLRIGFMKTIVVV
ncbi:MAG: hypothetical protein K0R76_1595 [Alphaproteobacteria bacterium]|jgi:hypothetical protein|nr:hypothetical protein [Alphaproteobacteria bacterium]MDF3034641.1 hypothetical protein [Alphaproteobacteria bacterium]